MDPKPKRTLQELEASKRTGRKFSVLTCYDASTARLMEQAGVEVILVGDTAGEVVLGLPGTRGTPPEFLLTLTAGVRRGAPNTFLMADLPYLCRSDNPDTTLDWCRRFQDETSFDVIKLEVTSADAALIARLHEAGIPTVAHLGLLPQQIEAGGGYRAQGRDAASGERLIEEARTLEQAGADMLLLEAVSSEVARAITQQCAKPVIGCVAGPHCDGTVVVLHDMAGWGGGHPPRAVHRYADVAELFTRAFARYVEDVQTGRFPDEQRSIHMMPGEYEKLRDAVKVADRRSSWG